jgi:hypothetical protein
MPASRDRSPADLPYAAELVMLPVAVDVPLAP